MGQNPNAVQELGTFLRLRREHLQPMDVGLDWGRRRRAKGLRRAEVASLAGVTESWYTRLEQGKAMSSASQLAGVSRALRLTPDESAYVRSLIAGDSEGTAVEPTRRIVSAEISLLLANVMPSPAYVIDENWDFLAWNPAYAALLSADGGPGLEDLEPVKWNLLWIMFCWPPYRALVAEWEREARKLLGQYRASLHLKANSQRLDEIAVMLADDPHASAWWTEHLIVGYSSDVLTFRHARAGVLPLKYVKLDLVDDPDQHVVVFMAASQQTRNRLETLSPGNPGTR